MINDERAADGMDHLQSAALELIQAARAFLDVAEDLVHDRDRVAEVVATAASMADVVAPDWATRRSRPRRSADHATRSASGAATDPETDPVADPATARATGRARPDTTDRVQRIEVS